MFRWLMRRFGRGNKAFAPSGDTGGSFADAYSAQPAPTASKLVREYKGVVYGCATLNAQSVAAVVRRVYATTSPGQTKCRWPSRKTLRSRALAKAQRGVDTEELTSHPLVRLLERPNPYMSGATLNELTDLYLELAGSAYWLIESNPLGVPQKLWLLQTQLVTSHRSSETGMVDWWEYGSGTRMQKYDPEEIVDFHMADPNNPYSQGLSPARGVWESINLLNKDKAHQSTLMDNRARPDAIVSPKTEEATMSDTQAQRVEKLLNAKFRKAGAGRLLVEGTPLNVDVLNFTSADMEMIQRYGVNKVEIMNAYGVPPALFDSSKSRAELEAALVQHSRAAILPRLRRLDERISQQLCPLFDERLFVASDDPTPEDVERAIAQHESLLRTGERVINDLRREDGQEEVEWGNEPWLANNLAQPTPAVIASSDVGQDIEVTEDAVLNGAQITAATAIVTAVALGQLPRDAGKGQLMVLFNLTEAQANAMLGTAGAGFVPTPSATAPAPAAVAEPSKPSPGAAPAKPPAPPKPANEEEAAKAEAHARRVLAAIRRSVAGTDALALAEELDLTLEEVNQATSRLQHMGLVSENGAH